jgi:DNA gyrase/topoisomerase IV subunit B
MLCRISPYYIKEGNAYVVFPPLFGATKKNKFIPIYSTEDRDSYEKKGYEINRFKGLGEMNADQLKQVISRDKWYRLQWPDTEEELDTLLNIINNKSYKKAIMNDDRFGFKTLLNHIGGK